MNHPGESRGVDRHDNAVATALESACAAFAAKRPVSQRLAAEASRVMPGGNTRTVLFHRPFPLRMVSGEGQVLTDADGLRYTDFLGEYSAGLFGHSHERVHRAVAEALATGLNLGAHHLDEIAFAEAVCRRFDLDLVRFTNSGTEANLMALGAARAHTGRSRILAFHGAYHGSVLSFAGGGTPVNAPYDIVLGEYNDVAGTEALLDRCGDELAAVLVEPLWGTGCVPGSAAFLSLLRRRASQHGTVLIFDEVMTSRLGPKGYSAWLGIQPDLKTFGKYVGGGMSFGAFGGVGAIMERFDPTRPGALPHAGTYNNNSLTMKVGLAALTEIFTPQACDDLNARGDRLRLHLDALFDRLGARLACTGQGSMIAIHPRRPAVRTPREAEQVDLRLRDILFLALVEEGFYLARRGYMALSLAITDADCEALAGALERAVLKHRDIFID